MPDPKIILPNADAWRRVQRAVRHFESKAPFDPGWSRLPTRYPERGPVIFNDSGEEWPAFGVGKVTGIQLIGDHIYALKCDKPDATFAPWYIANNEVPIADQDLGMGQVGPNQQLLYDSGTPAVNEGWGPKPSQWSLSKGFPNTTLVSGIVDSDRKILLGTLAPIVNAIGKTTGAITGGTSATTSYDFYTVSSGALFSGSDTGFNTVPNAYSMVDIDSGLFIKLTWCGAWLIEPLECSE